MYSDSIALTADDWDEYAKQCALQNAAYDRWMTTNRKADKEVWLELCDMCLKLARNLVRAATNDMQEHISRITKWIWDHPLCTSNDVCRALDVEYNDIRLACRVSQIKQIMFRGCLRLYTPEAQNRLIVERGNLEDRGLAMLGHIGYIGSEEASEYLGAQRHFVHATFKGLESLGRIALEHTDATINYRLLPAPLVELAPKRKRKKVVA